MLHSQAFLVKDDLDMVISVNLILASFSGNFVTMYSFCVPALIVAVINKFKQLIDAVSCSCYTYER